MTEVNAFFARIYRFFHRRKILLYALLLAWAVGCGAVLSRIKFEEDISAVFPNDEKVKKATDILKNSPLLKRIYLVVSVRDTTAEADLKSAADRVEEKLKTYGGDFLHKADAQVEEEAVLGLIRLVYDNIPGFLDSSDYRAMDTLLQPEKVHEAFASGYNQLLSPAGFALKESFLRDPLGITWRGMRKLDKLSLNQKFTLSDGYLMTRDGHNLMIFVDPATGAGKTANGKKLVKALDQTLAEVEAEFPNVQIRYYGAPAVSVANAIQVRRDVFLTVGLAFLLLNIILVAYFRKWYTIPLLMSPVLFGSVTALAVLMLVNGSISSIALGIGSVMLGLILDYSIHAYTHQRENGNAEKMVGEIAALLLATSGTTVLAFCCLLAMKSNLLKELGLFAAVSVGSAALFTIIVYPHFLGKPRPPKPAPEEKKTNRYAPKSVLRLLNVAIFLAAGVSVFYMQRTTFENDMNKYSYVPPRLVEAENYLDKISDFKLKNIYLVSEGNDVQEALRDQQRYLPVLDSLRRAGTIDGYTSVNTYWPSQQQRENNLRQWKNFWTAERRQTLRQQVETETRNFHFKPGTFDAFLQWTEQPSLYTDEQAMEQLRGLFFNDLVQEREGNVQLIALIRVKEENKPLVYAAFHRGELVFDNTYIFHRLLDVVRHDFQLLGWLSTLLVLGVMLLTFRRSELALAAMIPTLMGWIIVLGAMGFFHIPFNIFNVIICTFIFGLSNDYAIFLGRGLLDEYRSNSHSLPTFQVSIVLSMVNTLLSMGVLIFAQHPALKSVALVSLVGLTAVALITFILQPFVFRFLLAWKGVPRKVLLTPFHVFMTIVLLGTYILLALVIFISGIVLVQSRIVPGGRKILERMFSLGCRMIVFMGVHIRKKYIHVDRTIFREPSILISNHQSMLDLVMLASLSGKIRVVTKDWIFKTPLLGTVARMLGFYRMEEATAPDFAERVKADLAAGYTVMFFPEGSRSKDLAIHRFHKGAFLLAEQTGADILPMLIYGTGVSMPPGALLIGSGKIAVKILPRIKANDTQYPADYAQRTKAVGEMMRKEYQQLGLEEETTRFLRRALHPRYAYRAPEVRRAYRQLLKEEEKLKVLNRLIGIREEVLLPETRYGELVSVLLFHSALRKVQAVSPTPESRIELEFLKHWHEHIYIHAAIPESITATTLVLPTDARVDMYIAIRSVQQIIIFSPGAETISLPGWKASVQSGLLLLERKQE